MELSIAPLNILVKNNCFLKIVTSMSKTLTFYLSKGEHNKSKQTDGMYKCNNKLTAYYK